MTIELHQRKFQPIGTDQGTSVCVETKMAMVTPTEMPRSCAKKQSARRGRLYREIGRLYFKKWRPASGLSSAIEKKMILPACAPRKARDVAIGLTPTGLCHQMLYRRALPTPAARAPRRKPFLRRQSDSRLQSSRPFRAWSVPPQG